MKLIRRPPAFCSLWDSRTGDILADRILDDDVYDLALAKIPESILPRGEVEAL